MNLKSRLSFYFLLILLSGADVSVFAQKIKQADLDALSKEYAIKSLSGEFREFLSIPNVALYEDHIRKNLDWLKPAFENRGFETREMPTSSRTAFWAQRKVKGAKKTVLFYMHFDGQPVDPTKWNQEDPFKPVLKRRENGQWREISWEAATDNFDDEWRVFARAAADDKGPIMMLLQAMDILNDRNQEPGFNIKVILDPEEEMGAKGMPEIVAREKEALAADEMIIMDGPMHGSNRPTLVFGSRGIGSIELTVFGPRVPQHSGHFGNYAPNPALRLSRLLASMKDEQGRVTIPGFYDGIDLTPEIQAVLKAVPDDVEALHKRIGIAQPDSVGRYYQESIQYPSLNIRGLKSAWVGKEVRTIVPDKAIAAIDIRLVPETDGARLVSLVRNHITEAGYFIVDNRDPTEEERMTHAKILRFDYNPETMWKAFSTPVNSPTGNWLYHVLKNSHEQEVARIRLLGGSVPIAVFVNGLNIPAVLVTVVNPDNNQHSPNENLRLGHYRNGIKTVLAILLSKG